MGSFFEFIDVDEDSMAKKVFMHKRHGGLEAPRNSLELPMGTSYDLYAGRDNILYAYHVMDEFENCYSSEASMKKLMDGDISKRSNSKQNAPSVVARLMGVDTFPIDSIPGPNVIRMKNGARSGKLQDKEESKKGSVFHAPSPSNSPQQLNFIALGHDIMDRDFGNRALIKSNKPRRREHPQEEELQKFKKEFEAWQAARMNLCSKVEEFSNTPCELIAREDLNRERMFLYANSKRVTTGGRQMVPEDLAVITAPNEMFTSQAFAKKNKPFPPEVKESFYSHRRSRTDSTSSRAMNSYQKIDVVSAPTKIVILRPGPERITANEDSWNSSPVFSEERGSIEDFLEEVKERLKSELQGKSSKRSTTVRGGGIETPYWEKPTEPRRIAQRIAQQVRDNVGRDLGKTLHRSESTKSYRSDDMGSPEFINRDTRKFLAERLKNVLKSENHREIPVTSRCSSRSSVSENEKRGATNSRTIRIENEIGCIDGVTFELEKQIKSFRREELSPRNLVRSLSAPVSGTSFRKLLLEDRHIVTGAQIRRKHEVIEKVPLTNKKKKDKFNIREKVSNLRYSWTLRGRIFRRRVRSMDGSYESKNDFWKDINSGPTVMMGFETNENFTEVPPSPASACSSVHEELLRHADYTSSTSSCSIRQLDDNEIPHVFTEITSNLTELRRKLNQLEGGDSLDENVIDQKACEVEIDIEDPAEAYIKDLLVASGLYDGSYNRSLSKWDPLGKPISNQVFEEVELSYGKIAKDDETRKKDQGEQLNHKIFLDLTNEVLPTVLRPPVNISRYMHKTIGPMHKPPQGKKLLFRVWEMIRDYVHPLSDRSYYSLDNMLARDLKSDPWTGLMDDHVDTLGRDFECQIMADLIEEVLQDMH